MGSAATTPPRLARLLGAAGLCCCALALGAAQPAGAADLSLGAASSKAADFAKRTCGHDKACVSHGVASCHRERPRLAFCRIFVSRDTEVQGRYRCTRRVRLSLIPGTRHARVSGLGDWRC